MKRPVWDLGEPVNLEAALTDLLEWVAVALASPSLSDEDREGLRVAAERVGKLRQR